jgi:hypothetical protein
MGKLWKKGRGKLGLMEPLLGDWLAEADSPMGPVRCERSLEQILGGAYIRLDARWKFAKPPVQTAAGSSSKYGKPYQELAIFGPGDEGKIVFWSFTSDGKRSEGKLTDASDIHEEAIAFEAKMPAGIARMVYWPDGEDGLFWAAESKSAKGWNRFVKHHCSRIVVTDDR